MQTDRSLGLRISGTNRYLKTKNAPIVGSFSFETPLYFVIVHDWMSLSAVVEHWRKCVRSLLVKKLRGPLCLLRVHVTNNNCKILIIVFSSKTLVSPFFCCRKRPSLPRISRTLAWTVCATQGSWAVDRLFVLSPRRVFRSP